MAAVQNENDGILMYACESLRNDRQVVMAACSGMKHASAALRNDRELVLRAVGLGMMHKMDVALLQRHCVTTGR